MPHEAQFRVPSRVHDEISNPNALWGISDRDMCDRLASQLSSVMGKKGNDPDSGASLKVKLPALLGFQHQTSEP